ALRSPIKRAFDVLRLRQQSFTHHAQERRCSHSQIRCRAVGSQQAWWICETVLQATHRLKTPDYLRLGLVSSGQAGAPRNKPLGLRVLPFPARIVLRSPCTPPEAWRRRVARRRQTSVSDEPRAPRSSAARYMRSTASRICSSIASSANVFTGSEIDRT